jgi:hypothetical protein
MFAASDPLGTLACFVGFYLADVSAILDSVFGKVYR